MEAEFDVVPQIYVNLDKKSKDYDTKKSMIQKGSRSTKTFDLKDSFNTAKAFELLSWMRYRAYTGDILPLFDLHDKDRPLIEKEIGNNEESDDEESKKPKEGEDEFTALDLPPIDVANEKEALKAILKKFKNKLAKIVAATGTLGDDEVIWDKHNNA